MSVEIPERIIVEKIVPVARGIDASSAGKLVDALVEGGCTLVEITVERSEAIEAIRSVAGSGVTVGAGTVTTIGQARAAVEAGAEFLVSPHVDTDLIAWTTAEQIPYIPGAFTPSEVHTAVRMRAPAVKVFPAFVGGPAMLRALLGPFPGLSLIPTGGINADNARSYLESGALAVGVGGWLTGHNDPAVITERARMLRSVVG